MLFNQFRFYSLLHLLFRTFASSGFIIIFFFNPNYFIPVFMISLVLYFSFPHGLSLCLFIYIGVDILDFHNITGPAGGVCHHEEV